MRMARAIGYCNHQGCPLYLCGVFLLNRQKFFKCMRCHKDGDLQRELGYAENAEPIFQEVRLAYDYDPKSRIYRTTAIIRDESLWGIHNIYHYTSPTIRTEKQALKSAESILATLNHMTELPAKGELPNWYESRLSWDDSPEDYQKQLTTWSEALRRSPLSRSK